jgi:hypothetical protein
MYWFRIEDSHKTGSASRLTSNLISGKIYNSIAKTHTKICSLSSAFNLYIVYILQSRILHPQSTTMLQLVLTRGLPTKAEEKVVLESLKLKVHYI